VWSAFFDRALSEKDRMTARKQKQKDRRRARKFADEAWETANAGNLDLALKIIRRAADTQPDNPVLWNDLGALLVRQGDEREAVRAFQAALSLAPDYAEPYSHLAALRLRQGRVEDAIAIQTQAVRCAPEVPAHAERLAAYRALAGQLTESPVSPSTEETPVDALSDPPPEDWAARLADLDWHSLGKRLTREGCLLLAGLVGPENCAVLRSWFDDDERFAKTVVMDRPDYGKGTYRYFRPPLPAVVDGLRRAVYPYAARIANGWQELLNDPERFPDEWEGFRDICRAGGQSVPTPILLKYEAGGFNALHRDLRGSIYFPLQLAVVLSPRATPGDEEAREGGFQGGDFLLCDVPEGPKAVRRVLPAGLGDTILFCTRDRPATVGGTYGLLPVMHAVTPITAGTRFVLGVPFHEYR
jgi:hypothetical protein